MLDDYLFDLFGEQRLRFEAEMFRQPHDKTLPFGESLMLTIGKFP